MIVFFIILYINKIKKHKIGSIELLHIQNAHHIFTHNF